MPSDNWGNQPPANSPRITQRPYQGDGTPPGYQGGGTGGPAYPVFPAAPGGTGAPVAPPTGPQPGVYPTNDQTPRYTAPPSGPSGTYREHISPPYQPQPQPQQDQRDLQTPADATPAQRSRWPLVAGGIVLLVLILGGAFFAISQLQLQQPMAVATSFCNDMKTQKYTDAYGLLSSGYQAHVSSSQFAQLSQLHDQLDGKVKSCGLAGFQGANPFALNPTSVSINGTIARTKSYSGAMTLVKQNGTWKVDALADTLQGSDVGAWTTTALFCQALSKKDYTSAYNLFTPAYQQQIGTASAYANGLKQVFGGGQFQISGCQPQVDTYTVTPQGDSASLSGSFAIKVTTDAGALTVPVPFKISFAKIAGSWKISDLEVVQSAG